MMKGLSISILVIVVGCFILTALYGMGKRANAVRENCTPTSLYTIGDKGHVNQVYECPEQEKDE